LRTGVVNSTASTCRHRGIKEETVTKPAGRAAQRAQASWAGTTLADRRAVRRQQLLAVGLDLLGTHGSGAVTVRSVCRAAGLTDRYFYENFAGREELLLAVYDSVAAEAQHAIMAAVAASSTEQSALARAAVEGFLSVLADDPRKGRVLLLEPLSDATLREHAQGTVPMFEALVRAQLAAESHARPIAVELTATAMVGALTLMFIRWLDEELLLDRSELADYCASLLLSTTSMASWSSTSTSTPADASVRVDRTGAVRRTRGPRRPDRQPR
jgi:AcrR family transcriptional regulator